MFFTEDCAAELKLIMRALVPFFSNGNNSFVNIHAAF